MPSAQGKNQPGQPRSAGAAIRAIAPLLPLAVALGHSALTAKPAATPTTTIVDSSLTTPAPSLVMASAPVPMLTKGHPVDWWFVFKLNAKVFPECGGGTRSCPFGGTVQPYKSFSQQYVYASSESPTLQDGEKSCLGTTTSDPVGASFDEVYNGNFHYVVWNDQMYGDPLATQAAPWGHSKGMVAWNDAGAGFVMQVSTPSWPASGNVNFPRKTDGNTLGCVKDDDVQVSQHFFALRLTKSDLVLVLQGLANASVVTDPTNKQIVNNGGPDDVQALVNSLGKKSSSDTVVQGTLSLGVKFLSKPSNLNVPPWQMVSAELGGVGLRAATWWASPEIPSTDANSTISCWDESLGTPGPVEIATSGTWEGKIFSLKGGLGTDFNHAKIGVSTSGTASYAIFGDENQQGALEGNCKSSQNGRGGTFYAMDNAPLAKDITKLITGPAGTDSASAGSASSGSASALEQH